MSETLWSLSAMTKIQISDLEDYLEGFHQYDGYAMACCPFHDDHSPSLLITEDGYYCKSNCGGGSLNKLYTHVSGRPVQVTKREYNPSAFIWDRWTEQYGSIEATCHFGHNQLTNRPELGEYLYKRGLTSTQIKHGHLGFLGGYYLFPIFDPNGKIQGAVARASPTIQTKNNRYSATKDCPVKIYTPDWLTLCHFDEIYVCFGTLDSWSIFMAGFPSLTGISGQQFRAEHLDEFRKIIYIIPDKREEKSALRLQGQLGWRGRRLDIDWPDGTKDLNDVHVKYGLDKVKELIEEAKKKYE